MAKLTAKERNALPAKDFLGPHRSYPVPDRNHAKAALSMSAQHAYPALKAKIAAKVHKKFPDLGKGK